MLLYNLEIDKLLAHHINQTFGANNLVLILKDVLPALMGHYPKESLPL